MNPHLFPVVARGKTINSEKGGSSFIPIDSLGVRREPFFFGKRKTLSEKDHT